MVFDRDAPTAIACQIMFERVGQVAERRNSLRILILYLNVYSAAPAPPQYPARRRQRGRHARDLLDQLGVVRHHAHPPPHGLAQAQVLDGERVGPDRLLVFNVGAERVGLVLQRRGDPCGDERHIPRRAVRRGVGRVGARAVGVVVVLRLGRLALNRCGQPSVPTAAA